jgi:hypothetical protein
MRKILIFLLLISGFTLYGKEQGDTGEVTGSHTEPTSQEQLAQSTGSKGTYDRKWSLLISEGYGSQMLQGDQYYMVGKDRTMERRLLMAGLANPQTRDFSTYYLLTDSDLPGPKQPGFASVSRVFAERRFSYIGVNIGFTNGNYEFRNRRNPIHFLLLSQVASVLPSFDTPEGRSFYQYLWFEEELRKYDSDYRQTGTYYKRTGTHYGVQMADAGLTFHLQPEGSWDPYAQLGVRIGYCDVTVKCPVYGGYAAMGIRYNINRFFVFSGLEHQSLRMNVRDRSTPWLPTNTANIGAGLYL